MFCSSNEPVSVPYASATSGERARGEIRKLLQRFGCESVGFMDEFAEGTLLLAFKWRGHQVQLKASAKGWADMFLKEVSLAHPPSLQRGRVGMQGTRSGHDRGQQHPA